jgi:hypothetical protein
MTTRRAKLTEPLETVTAFFATCLLLALAAGVVLTLTGSGSLGGFGHTVICVTQPRSGYGGDWGHPGVAARPGIAIQMNGTLQACARHPGIGPRVLYTLMTVPGSLVWAAVLLLLWRLIRAARQAGPFTVQAAAAMRRLGWLIIAGTAAAGVLQGFAQDRLINTMLMPPGGYGDVFWEPLRALVPVPLLAGTALLTFARVIRLGADMDDEIKATV